jgi:hypothetical protein
MDPTLDPGEGCEAVNEILDDIKKSRQAHNTLEAIAKGKDKRLTADQARRLLKHMEWLSKERSSLLDSGCFDD